MNYEHLATLLSADVNDFALLKENSRPPTGKSRQVLQDVLAKAQRTRLTLDATSEDAKSQHGSITGVAFEESSRSLHILISELNQVLAPIRLLPVELLEACFLECATDRASGRSLYGESRSYRIHDGPWYLKQVCREWRVIAINYPYIWTTVDIEVIKECPSMPLIEEAFLRSKLAPISLSVSYRTGHSGTFLSTLIYPQLRRAKEFTLRMLDNAEVVLAAHPIPFSQMQMLKSLKLLISTIRGPDRLLVEIGPIIFPEDKTIEAPFTSLFASFWLDPAFISLPWKQLTRIVTYSDDIVIRSIISFCPNLLYIKSIRNDPYLGHYIPEPLLVHSKLEEWISHCPRTFMSIKAPGLKKLAVGPYGVDINELPYQLSHLLKDIPSSTGERVSADLESFHLRLGGICSSFVNTLFSLHALQTLALTIIYDEDALLEFVETMTTYTGHTSFLPCLRSLDIVFEGIPYQLRTFSFLNRKFIVMLQSRQATLRSVHLRGSYRKPKWEDLPTTAFDTQDLEGLELLRSTGMVLSILEGYAVL